MSQEEEDKNTDEEAETNQRIAFNFIEVYPEDLKQHEVNTLLYGEDKADADLVDSIRRKGLLEPLIITEDYRIISGHRRWRALITINKEQLGRLIVDDKKDTRDEAIFVKRKAKCQIAHFKNEDEEKLAIIEYNRRRDKRYSQMYNEIEMLHDLFDEDALNNKKSGLKQNTDVPTLVRRLKESEYCDEVDWNCTPEEIAYEWGWRVGGPKLTDKEEYDAVKAKTSEKIAKALGPKIGKTNVDKLTEIGRFAREFSDEVAIQAMERLDKGIWKINAAHIVVKMRKTYLSRNAPGAIYCRDLLREIDRGVEIKEKKEKGKILTPAAAKRELDLQIPKDKREKLTISYSTTIKNTYSVLYFDFPDMSVVDPESDELPDNIKEIMIPAATNSALFLTANVENIKYCANLIKIWGFKLKSYIIIEIEKKDYGNWFPSGYNILLFSTRGKWSPPAPENRYKGEIIKNIEEIPDIIASMYPNVKSLYQIGVEVDRQPLGWGMSLEQLKLQEIQKENSLKNSKEEEEMNVHLKDDRPMNPGMQGEW